MKDDETTNKTPLSGSKSARTVQVENVQTVECPYHFLPLEVKSGEKEVEDLEHPGRTKKITIQYAECFCEVPDNAMRGRRVWEKS